MKKRHIDYQRELERMGFNTFEELQEALNKYKDIHFPELNLDDITLDDIENDFDLILDCDFNFEEPSFDFSFLDDTEEEEEQ